MYWTGCSLDFISGPLGALSAPDWSYYQTQTALISPAGGCGSSIMMIVLMKSGILDTRSQSIIFQLENNYEPAARCVAPVLSLLDRIGDLMKIPGTGWLGRGC